MKARSLSFTGLVLLFIASLTISQKSSAQTSGGPTEFAYSVDQDSNTILGFNIASSGDLLPLTNPSFPTGSAPNGVAADPKGRFIYVVNLLSNDVSGYAIAKDGSLNPVPGSPFPAGSGPGWVTVDPSGKFVYVANCAALCSGSGQGNVSGYAINQTTGALTPVPGSPFQADEIPYAIAVDSSGDFTYVANFRSGTVSVFKIDRSTGSLAAVGSPVPTGGANSIWLALDPQEHFLYVVNTASQNVSAFAVGAGGTLTAVPGSPFVSGEFTQGIAFDRSGKFLYVSSGFEVLGYSIQTGGAIIPLSGSPYPAPGFLVGLSLDPSGHYIYGAATSSGIAAYNIAASGDLTVVPDAPFPAGSNAVFVTTTVGH